MATKETSPEVLLRRAHAEREELVRALRAEQTQVASLAAFIGLQQERHTAGKPTLGWLQNVDQALARVRRDARGQALDDAYEVLSDIGIRPGFDVLPWLAGRADAERKGSLA